jgi:transposase
MVRAGVLSDDMWARVEPLLPCSAGRRGRPFRDHRQVIEGVLYRLRTGVPWRDLPVEFGPWQTVWKRHARFSRDGTWDRLLEQLAVEADAGQSLEWTVSVDSTVVRAHQHGTNLRRVEREDAAGAPGQARGPVELQESA